MQGSRGWRRWCCHAPGNEPHNSPLSNEKVWHIREAVRIICSPVFYHWSHSLDSFDLFDFLDFNTFDLKCSSLENSATYSLLVVACVLPLSSVESFTSR